MKELPVVCTLETGERADRAGLIREALRGAVVGSERSGSKLTLTMPYSAGTRQRLEELIGLESACCAFLDFSLAEAGSNLVLEVEGPKGSEPVIEAFAAAAL